MGITEAIQNEIIRQGLTQEQVGERADMRQAEVSRALSEGRDPRASTLDRLIKALGCEVKLIRSK